MIEEVATYLADDDPPGSPEQMEREAWYRRISVGAAGFFLAVMLSVINTFYSIRGAVIVVQPPEQVVLYRDGDGDKAVLTLAMRVAMINATDSQHGDVLMEAAISPMKNGPKFAYAATVQPVFTSDPRAGDDCEIGARCIAHNGFLAIERTDQIIDIPGAAVKAPYFAYPIASWNCDGDAAACDKFANFDTAVTALAKAPSDFTVRVEYYSDGDRTLTCRGRAIDVNYLRSRGWMTISCKEASVEGAPFF
jgi:hypothetical protein